MDENDALYPLLHVYIAVLPKARPELRATLPLAGLLKLGHDNATKVQVEKVIYLISRPYLVVTDEDL